MPLLQNEEERGGGGGRQNGAYKATRNRTCWNKLKSVWRNLIKEEEEGGEKETWQISGTKSMPQIKQASLAVLQRQRSSSYVGYAVTSSRVSPMIFVNSLIDVSWVTLISHYKLMDSCKSRILLEQFCGVRSGWLRTSELSRRRNQYTFVPNTVLMVWLKMS